MSLSQQKFREIVFQLLYSYEIDNTDDELMINLMMGELAVSKKNVRLALERATQIKQKLSEIDPMISSVAISYGFERIQTVTIAILRLGVFELFFDEQIPPKVAIAEAIRLSRKFNTPESASFVNALLDHLYQASLGNGQLDSEKLKHLAEALEMSEKEAFQQSQEKQNCVPPLTETPEDEIRTD